MSSVLKWRPDFALVCLYPLCSGAADLVPVQQGRSINAFVIVRPCDGQNGYSFRNDVGLGVFADSVRAESDLCIHSFARAEQRSSLGSSVIEVDAAVNESVASSSLNPNVYESSSQAESTVDLRFRIDAPRLSYDLGLIGTASGRNADASVLVKLTHPSGTFEGQTLEALGIDPPEQSGQVHFQGALALGEYRLQVHLLTKNHTADSRGTATVTLRFEIREGVAARADTWSKVKTVYRLTE